MTNDLLALLARSRTVRNEGVAKVAAMALVGRGAAFHVHRTPDGMWVFELQDKHNLDVFPQHDPKPDPHACSAADMEHVDGVAKCRVCGATTKAVVKPVAPVWAPAVDPFAVKPAPVDPFAAPVVKNPFGN